MRPERRWKFLGVFCFRVCFFHVLAYDRSALSLSCRMGFGTAGGTVIPLLLYVAWDNVEECFVAQKSGAVSMTISMSIFNDLLTTQILINAHLYIRGSILTLPASDVVIDSVVSKGFGGLEWNGME